MYAVIKTGGKQYRVVAGQTFKVEQLPAEVGSTVSFQEVLALGAGSDLIVGTPLVAGARVEASVVAHGRGEKVRIFKLRRRKHYKKTQGHRQGYTEVFIAAIYGADGQALATAQRRPATAEAPAATVTPAQAKH